MDHDLTIEKERIKELEKAINSILLLVKEDVPKRGCYHGWDEYRINRIKSIATRVIEDGNSN